MEEKINIIEKTVKDLLAKLSHEGEVEVESDGREILVQIDLEEPGLMIGKNGYTLSDFQHLVRVITNRKVGDFTYLTIDINSYKLDQKEEAKREAQKVIEEVKTTKGAKALSPMNSFKRKIAHMLTKDEENIFSESVGQEPSRRVVIKYEETDLS